MNRKLEALAFAVTISWIIITGASCATRHSSSGNHGVYHIVQPGQNLYRISLAYKIPLETLVRTNGIRNPGSIRIGQRIFIPGATKRLFVPVVKSSTPSVYALPLAGVITSTFGARRSSGYHTGVDIAAPCGSKVKAALPGKVVFSGKLSYYGNVVKIQHEGGLLTLYAHNERNLVRVGQIVSEGQLIATVGRSGNASGCHLHFEVRRNGQPIDPLSVIQR